MAQIEASRVVPHPPEQVFAFLSDLGNHWQLSDAFIAVNGVRDGGGRIVIRGPLGLTREAYTEVVSVEPPRRLLGRASVGRRTVGSVSWDIAPIEGGSGSDVRLSARVDRASGADRLLLALGGRRWLTRRFAVVLENLGRRLG